MARERPYGVFDSTERVLVYIGLHDCAADVWKVFLGWPSDGEIDDAKRRGLEVFPIRCRRAETE